MSETTAPQGTGKWPRQIPYIIANEACERFSFYGMRNILTMFLTSSIMLAYAPIAEREGLAKEIFHTFVIGVYFFPILGGWIADRILGKYRTIMYFSLLYCIGQGMLALFVDHRLGFYSGLFLVAFGSGGIKPLVASFMGDQFDQSNKHLARLAFDAFYWIINFGSLFASLLMPYVLRNHGPEYAFGIPGILMFIATVFFWMGRRRYVHVPPAPANPHSFLNVARTALFTRGSSNTGFVIAMIGFVLALVSLLMIPKLGFVSSVCLAIVAIIVFGGFGANMQLDRARGKHPDEAVEGVRAVLRLLIVFGLITPFWSLFDQKASTWVLQANTMVKPEWFEPSQMQALNPLLVMILIPFNNLVLYPLLRKLGIEPTAIRRMGFGIAFSGLAFVAAGLIQLEMDGGTPMSITWQMLPYALLTFAEVLVSATGLEFAYSQAPASMKGVIMAFWYLSVTIGNLWVLLANSSVKHPVVLERVTSTGLSQSAFLLFFFAGFALLASMMFGWYAKYYKTQDNYRAAG